MIWVPFLLLNANVVLNTCYQNSGYFDKVCSYQKGIILFVVVMMQRQGAAFTCQPMNYKWILSWKGDSSSGVPHTHLNRRSGGTRVPLHSHRACISFVAHDITVRKSQTWGTHLCWERRVQGVKNSTYLTPAMNFCHCSQSALTAW